MRCAALSVCVLFAALFCVKAADPPRDEEMVKVDNAVDQALAFLQSQQLGDGGWPASERRGGSTANPAITSLCVMAFLSAGRVPGEGRYGATIEKGIRFVLQSQESNGLIAKGAGGNQEMYSHGISTLMLAEAAGMTDGDLGKEIRRALKDAVKVILAAQRTENGPARGGWRYTLAHTDSDMSVTGWQIMALRAAKNLGCDVPARNIDEAVAFIKRCQDYRTGGFNYLPGSNLTIPVTGTSILALELCGRDQHHSPEVLKAGGYLEEAIVGRYNNPPLGAPDVKSIELLGNFHYYGVYYCSQAMFQLGGNYWDSYRPVLHEILFGEQRENGSWGHGPRRGAGGDGGYGSSYCTAMCVLALTVEYRYLPIYQRGEEPNEKDK